jgi:hypothetical protein
VAGGAQRGGNATGAGKSPRFADGLKISFRFLSIADSTWLSFN